MSIINELSKARLNIGVIMRSGKLTPTEQKNVKNLYLDLGDYKDQLEVAEFSALINQLSETANGLADVNAGIKEDIESIEKVIEYVEKVTKYVEIVEKAISGIGKIL